MSIIPVICYNYMVNSRRRREKDNVSYCKKTNSVDCGKVIPAGLSTKNFTSIAEYREAYHNLQKLLKK